MNYTENVHRALRTLARWSDLAMSENSTLQADFWSEIKEFS